MAVQLSSDGQLLACLASNGHLRVFDAQSGSLRTQRAANMRDPAAALAWPPAPLVGNKGKRKKKSIAPTPCTDLALGSASGQVAIFSTVTSETTDMTDRHDGRVNSLAWSANQDRLYTGSADKTIGEWSVAEHHLVRKWTGDKRGVAAVAFGTPNDVATLVSAGSSIKVWNLAENEPTVLKKITGHENPVAMLHLMSSGHVLSAVAEHPDECNVCVWNAEGTKKEKSPTVTLALPTNAVSLSYTSQQSNTLVLAVTKDGRICIFSHDLSQTQKPIKPSSTIDIKTGDIPSQAVPAVAAMFDPRFTTSHIILARGSIAAPAFESLEFTTSKGAMTKELHLTREAPQGLLLSADAPGARKSKTASSEQPADATILGAADAARPIHKRKKAEHDEGDDVPLADKVRELNIEQPSKAKAAAGAPQAGSLAQMLVQALHSNDDALLEECLNYTSESVVRSTVARLPPTYIVRFFSSVVSKFQAKPSRGLLLLVWIRTILVVHTSYLMTVPDLAHVLSSLYSLVEARLTTFPRLLKLSGRLDLMLSQITSRDRLDGEADDDFQVPLNTYQDDSDDEAMDAARYARLDSDSEGAEAWETDDDEDDEEEDDEDAVYDMDNAQGMDVESSSEGSGGDDDDDDDGSDGGDGSNEASGPVGLDAGRFLDCLKGLLEGFEGLEGLGDLGTPHGGASSESGEPDFAEVCAQMDAELQGTDIPKSFEKARGAGSADSSDDAAENMDADLDGENADAPVDVDLNLVKNFLESFSSQAGLSGPVSSILGSLDLQLPQEGAS
eukprot:m.135831 g.135831  ORF g.135831 m.135831 type:complete len:785 (-) comp9895_c1_seq1:85-2439(-)